MKCDSLRSAFSGVTLSCKIQLFIEWHGFSHHMVLTED